MLKETGIPPLAVLEKVFPSQDRLERGPVAVIECFQEIPCNPCWDTCKQGAILPLEDMNMCPQLDFDQCTGCGVCLSCCPGLAIFIVDCSYSRQEAIVRIPYEFLPVPKPGQKVSGLNRAGEALGQFEVTRVQMRAKQNKTNIVWLVVPQELCMEVRNIRVGGE